MRLAVWSPLPPSSSGIADYVAEQLGALTRRCDVRVVVEDPAAVEAGSVAGVPVVAAGAPVEADLDLYHLGNSPAHAYVYRAALARPGVVVLHDFCLHHLVLHETVESGDRAAYLREMRRAHGEAGTFVGRQVARALGGDLLPALYPLNDRVLDSCLALVGLTRHVTSRAALRLRERPVLHLPHHVSLPLDPVPSRDEARRALGLSPEALVVTAPGLATVSKRLGVAVRAIARLRRRHATLRLVVAGGVDAALPLAAWAREAGLGDALVVTGRLPLPDFTRHLAAADVVLSLRFPTHGEISGALVRALGVGRPALVTAGTPAEEEFPEGCVVPVDPGVGEEAEIEAFLARLLADAALRETIGRLAREHVATAHDLGATVARLADFLEEVLERRDVLATEVERRRVPEGSLLGYLADEVRWGALDLGLASVPPGVEPLLLGLTREAK
ncbi:MAG: glycosyltransferase family 4 protein [Acidobacteria bacterium]|nr:glycosyltransferase family 4 protein [Acidobacteriota bacterium]